MDMLKADKPNRREFLYYVGGASLALVTAGICGALSRFLTLSHQYGVESGVFLVDTKKIPEQISLILHLSEGLYYLIPFESGFIALNPQCTLVKIVIPCSDGFQPTSVLNVPVVALNFS